MSDGRDMKPPGYPPRLDSAQRRAEKRRAGRPWIDDSDSHKALAEAEGAYDEVPIIDLDSRRRIWANSLARCGSCGRSWVATWPAYAADAKIWGWECPGCGQMTGTEIERLT